MKHKHFTVILTGFKLLANFLDKFFTKKFTQITYSQFHMDTLANTKQT